MPVVIPISDWITYAKITQYLFATNAAKNRIFNGGNLSSSYGNILRVTRCLVETAYNRNPNDETLNETGLFLRSLIDEQSAVIIVANGGCVSPIIVTNPISQSIDSGDNVTFTDEAGKIFVLSICGQFFRRGEGEYDLEHVMLIADGITLHFEVRLFDDQL